MSQMRAMRVGLRAIAAVIAVCALVFSLLVAGATHHMREGASANIAPQRQAHMAVCHDYTLQLSAFGSSTPADDGPVDRTSCPDCCLAALMASAVLPERIATFARPMRAAAPISYFAFAPNESDASVSGAVNGARAPPSRNSIS
jgi:hypothetical protein